MARWDKRWWQRLDAELVKLPDLAADDRAAVRRALGHDPVAFAYIYLREHLRDKRTERITFAECHYEWARLALTWDAGSQRIERAHRDAQPYDDRHAIIAPRETGKSTWWYLILPMWAGAYGHKDFVGAFAHATTQAEVHLASFKNELDTNSLLRNDFPKLCTPAKRLSGTQVADRAGMLHTSAGFVFAARGIDAQSLGMKVGHVRPDLIIADDIEPDEAKYSGDLVKKRLGTLMDAILPMNIYATVVIVGTVQMPGSIIHQFVRVSKGDVDDDTDWIVKGKFRVHWHRAIVTNDDGTLRSLWPDKWPLQFLLDISGTRSYLKNYENDPPDGDGSWWRGDDIIYTPLDRDEMDRVVLVVDGAVTTKKKSDYTGLAVVGLSVEKKSFFVMEAIEVRQGGEDLRDTVMRLIHEHSVSYILVESNQGGDLWHTVFHDMPVLVETYTQSEKKEVRLRRSLAAYQRAGRPVRHIHRLPAYERRMVAYPHTDHDDVLDAVAAAIEHLVWILLAALGKAVTKTMVRKFSYTGEQ